MKLNEAKDLKGWTAVVTGSTSGLGLALTKKLLLKGCTVFLTGSTQAKCDRVVNALMHELDAKNELDIKSLVIPLAADLKDPTGQSVRDFVKGISSFTKKVDLLFLNAGMIYSGGENVATDSVDILFRVNCLSQILLADLLVPLLNLSIVGGRIVFTGSAMLYGGSKEMVEKMSRFNPFNPNIATDQLKAYCNSKLCLAIFAKQLQQELVDLGSKIIVVHFIPGMVLTSLKDSGRLREEVKSTSVTRRGTSWWGMRHRFSADEGAEFLLNAAFITPPFSTGFSSLGSYKCPFLFTHFLSSSMSTRMSVFLSSLFWINENFQRLTADPLKLHVWEDSPLVGDSGFRATVCEVWRKIISFSG